MNRFEQLIEYVINDEDQKARELFHDIVVAKSREIYENLMQEEAEEELDEAAEEELDEAAEEEEVEESIGGDASDDLIDDVETEEESDMNMEGAEEEEIGGEADDDGDEVDFGGDEVEIGGDEGSGEAATKDDIMNLEDKLDQLMAEFEAAMGGDDMGSDGDGFGPEEGGDAIEMDDTEEMGMMEAVTLKAAPKPVTTEEGDGKAGPVAFNSGKTGMAAKPVSTGASQGGSHDSSAYRNTTKDLIGKVGNSPAQGTQEPKPATKPHLAQATGVNTKSPLPGRKG